MSCQHKHTGKVVTVLGQIDPQSLGKTMMHEHIIWNYALCYDSPRSAILAPDGVVEDEKTELWNAPLSLENLGHIGIYFNQNRDNLILEDVPTMSAELWDFKKYGGGTIVELSCKDTASDPVALKKISEETGVHIVCSTCYYLDIFHPPDMGERTVEQLAEEFISDIENGFGDSGICAGIIGEVGCSTNTRPNEVKVLKAAARAQKTTGVPISIHPGLRKEDPSEILDILEAEGADLSRVIMGHIDRGILQYDDLLKLAQRGCILEFDFFGSNFAYVMLSLVDFPSDFERCKVIRQLRDDGYIHQIVISHDLSYKSYLKKYGGTGYTHILKNIVPYMMRIGFTQKDIDILLIENPKRILTVT